MARFAAIVTGTKPFIVTLRPSRAGVGPKGRRWKHHAIQGLARFFAVLHRTPPHGTHLAISSSRHLQHAAMEITMDSRFEQWAALTDEYAYLLIAAARGEVNAWAKLRQLSADIRALGLSVSAEG